MKQTQRTIVMCAINWSLVGMKQFLYAIHGHSEKRIDIHYKVTFGFKYIWTYWLNFHRFKKFWYLIASNWFYLYLSRHIPFIEAWFALWQIGFAAVAETFDITTST